MTSTITPLKIYREWFNGLEVDWANEIAQNVIKDVLLTSSLFLSGEDDTAYMMFESIDNFPARLLTIIDENINNRNIDYERLLCQQLLISTKYALVAIASNSDEVYKKLQENQMENLISNNLERSTFFEESLNKNVEYRHSAETLLAEWDKFNEKHFNLELFYQRYIDI